MLPVSDRLLENQSLEALFTIPSRQLARILLQTKNGIGRLESPVIARVFGTVLAIFPGVTEGVACFHRAREIPAKCKTGG